MVEQTPNLKLDLDAGTDYYNIGKFNGNFRTIDTFAGTIGDEYEAFLQELSLRYTKEEIDALLANKVNIGPMQKYDVPFSSDYYNAQTSYYYKTPFSDVTAHLHFRPTIGYINSNEVIAILPVGFRPPADIQKIGAIAGSISDAQSAIFRISTNGYIEIIRIPTGISGIYGFLSITFQSE